MDILCFAFLPPLRSLFSKTIVEQSFPKTKGLDISFSSSGSLDLLPSFVSLPTHITRYIIDLHLLDILYLLPAIHSMLRHSKHHLWRASLTPAHSEVRALFLERMLSLGKLELQSRLFVLEYHGNLGLTTGKMLCKIAHTHSRIFLCHVYNFMLLLKCQSVLAAACRHCSNTM